MQPQREPSVRVFKPGLIQDVVIHDLRRFTDERGWLAEIFRLDELRGEFYPQMAYISSTNPGVTRGPHEHAEQADLFCFIGPSNFTLRLWDIRSDSATFGHVMTVSVGEDNPATVLIPKGIVHAYRNVGSVAGTVINCPNRLFMGENRRERVDEVRYEDDPQTIFQMDD